MQVGGIQIGNIQATNISRGNTNRKIQIGPTTVRKIQFAIYKSEEYKSGNTNRENTNRTIQIRKYKPEE